MLEFVARKEVWMSVTAFTLGILVVVIFSPGHEHCEDFYSYNVLYEVDAARSEAQREMIQVRVLRDQHFQTWSVNEPICSAGGGILNVWASLLVINACKAARDAEAAHWNTGQLLISLQSEIDMLQSAASLIRRHRNLCLD